MSLKKAFLYSFEWRIYSFFLTLLILWANGSPLFSASFLSLQLTVVLTVAHMFWFYYRHDAHEKGSHLKPHAHA